MPWNEVTEVSQRKDFVYLAMQPGSNISELCRRFGISRRTGYKWISRGQSGEEDWACDRSRRPRRSPQRVCPEVEQLVLSVRDEHPTWGGRKIERRLIDLGHDEVPRPSTITAILDRNGRLRDAQRKARGPMKRFEREAPNQLWQMDFKGHFPTAAGSCHPLTVVDDHSRFALTVTACSNERADTVRASLAPVFMRYGLPSRILTDNGSSFCAPNSRYNYMSAWLIRLGVGISHGRPFHPQTQGKNERFNRTLKEEAIRGRNFGALNDCQKAFDRFRDCYNHERPHEALDMNTPASRYAMSPFAYPETLPEVWYRDDWPTCKVNPGGAVRIKGEFYPVGRAFVGEKVGLRNTQVDGVIEVYYCRQRIMVVDLRDHSWRQT